MVNDDGMEGHDLAPLQAAVKSNDLKQLELLLCSGAQVDAVDRYSRAAAHYAAETSVQSLDLLLIYNADPDIGDSHGATPLHWAAYKGNVECVGRLLSHGADVNVRNNSRETALFWAVRKTCLEVVTLLLDYNADPMLTNGRGELPVEAVLMLFYLGFASDRDKAILNLLLAAAGHPPQHLIQRKELRDTLTLISQDVPLPCLLHQSVTSLKQMCRYAIRRACGRSFLPQRVMSLPISREMKQYLTLVDRC